ncbi:MAG TPA: universal stress protein [Candidatus Binataceae bacterium]|nr:universal stress protein [Candidatus Binataceae bacterium]
MANGWKRILVPIQFSDRSPAQELELARELARTHKASITLLHVVPLSAGVTVADGGMAAQYYIAAEQDAKQKLGKLAQTRLKGFKTEIRVEIGDPAGTIVKQAGKLDADLVIMATHSHKGIKRFLLGSVAEHVVRQCPCALLTVRP